MSLNPNLWILLELGEQLSRITFHICGEMVILNGLVPIGMVIGTCCSKNDDQEEEAGK